MLTLDQVHAHYGKSHVLHGVSLRVERSEVVGLLGRNGVYARLAARNSELSQNDTTSADENGVPTQAAAADK